MIVDGKKRCSVCGNIKPVSEFNKNSSSNDGYRSECKVCRKMRYLKNSMSGKKRCAAYDKKHRTEKSNYNAKYYREHKK